jgi:hypothetical protein
MSIHWLVRRVFVLLLALGVATSGIVQMSFVQASDMGMAMSMNMSTDMLGDGVPCKDMPVNCSGGLSCVMCVALPLAPFTVRPAERIARQTWLPRVDGRGLSIQPALPPPIVLV